ncbi:aromatic acid exporter family protein [Caldibacillus lycopersici]|uniref:Aromatic acid exporter family protein n=1 Tax=Perspicuibacillus lycopersici TaxID=1325689 RepID=A0AAE3LRH3_9BACI|nr:aromatic acid exporter family protein [Perspicuibacillus lycopersici]MCU9614649.1 aromatic acid exporter family protein [Perspicuibacillus lycopersici]
MKLGARILKTGMAVVLALFLAQLLHLETPVFAAISAVFAIQPSIYRSYLTIIEQIQGNIIGAALAVIFVIIFGNHFLVIGLAAIILIMINLKLNIENTISLSVVTLIVIMETPGDAFISFAVMRFLTIMLGILSAFFVNMVFYPPKYESKLYKQISDSTNEILKWIRISNHQAAEQLLLKNTVESIKEQLSRIDQIYSFYKEERTLLKRNTQAKLRKLVIYRQMMTTSRKALDILKKLLHYENAITSLPELTAKQVQQKLEQLAANHEHLLLRYIGKAKQIHEEEMKEYETNRQDLLRMYREYQHLDHDAENIPHTFQFFASLLEYNEQLERLEILLASFESFHSDDQEVDITKDVL